MANEQRNILTEKVISPLTIAHVVLKTGKPKPMVAYYKAFLGAHIQYENETICFLAYDEEHHRIAIINFPTLGPKQGAGLDHVAFTFDSLQDLVLAYKQRKTRGIVPIWCVNHGITTSMYYQDPDGNKIETQVQNFDTVEEANAYMTSTDFTENPIGVDFDPEELVKRLESGEDERDIKKKPNIGPRSIESVKSRVVPPPFAKDSYEPIYL
ncbi:putative ring-cleavage extradiol dioxygenase [Pseudomassariella vexata]|uniref:Putative ring-cleavage extradiol dioxygenase n=1 Tax=Pseudomassariella vexata TaxID=1141098 RepID=A0A1Y2DEY9_9PEZI|nr:putative ring-cleavage extradiol dioxygenase [Pseudomassariella vexata]ORY57831.1 putative ring-cleavage extradiol dioxygenase [Pseudomassariella vexata]